jgi:hypothetical protein
MEKKITVELAASYSWAGFFCAANSTPVKNVKKLFLGAYPNVLDLIIETLDNIEVKFVRQFILNVFRNIQKWFY